MATGIASSGEILLGGYTPLVGDSTSSYKIDIKTPEHVSSGSWAGIISPGAAVYIEEAVAELDEEHKKSDIEWYTPDWIIDAARRTMGSINLDPCTTAEVNERIRAERFYTKEDDGLEQIWTGNVWLNPPYARGLIERFIDKFTAEWKRENVTRALVLTNSATETGWYQKLLRNCSMLLFFNSRVAFQRAAGKWKKPMQPQSLFYFGTEDKRFIENFGKHGQIVVSHSWLEG